MTITARALYERLEIPPNLQRHMLTTAGVAQLVLAAWRGPAIDGELVIRVLLVHDLGNIVKADYDALPHMLGEEQARVDHWRAVQARYRERFGTDDGVATRVLASEAGLDARGLSLLAAMDFWRTCETARGQQLEVMLAAYADQRVGPFGVISQRERFAEAVARYGAQPGSPMSTPRAAAMIECAYALEQRLFEWCTCRPEAIDDVAVGPLLPALLDRRLVGLDDAAVSSETKCRTAAPCLIGGLASRR